MTANMLGTEAAHIIPEAETVWFHSNNFLVDGGLGSTRNKLLLRADVHRVWDAQTFTFVPRRVGEGEEQTTEWVTYVLKRRTRPEVRLLYHDVRLQPLSEVSVLFLFCRFAWTIFDSLEIFLDRLVDRWLMMVDPLTGKMKSTQCSAKDCQDRKFTMRGRSASPVKRKAPESSTEGKRRAAVAEEGDEPATDLMVSESEKIACGAFGDQGSSDEEIGRGRKRRPRSVDLATRLWSDIAGTGRSTW